MSSQFDMMKNAKILWEKNVKLLYQSKTILKVLFMFTTNWTTSIKIIEDM